MAEPTACKLGYVEYGGQQYCHEHMAFREPGSPWSSCSAVERGNRGENIPGNIPAGDADD